MLAVVEIGAATDPALQAVGEVALVYALAAILAGYAHRLFVEVEERQEVAADIVTHLSEVNELLSDLHRVARTLPSSLDLGDTLAAGTARLHDLFDFTHLAVLVQEPATGTWRVEVADGVRLPPELPADGLPPPLAEAVATRAASSHAALPDGGVAAEASSGLYAPLVARDRLVGLLALEHRDPGRFGTRHVQLVNGLAEPLALAIDNALWFARLQALGAEGERSRIARSLHDGVGQGLAYIALELDRIGATHPHPHHARLRDDTRGLQRDVRETLHQLRAEVTESKDLGTLAEAHLHRFSERTGISASLSSEPTPERLPVLVEHEVWRILQE
ncbi:MAG: histidine kinase, partial [Acidimicrobiia bacterium]